MEFTLHVWKQKNKQSPGKLETYHAKNVTPDMSFLEMLDIVNEELVARGDDPIAFEYDCREGICGTCSLMINGNPHGRTEHHPRGVTSCQVYMRDFRDGEHIYIEPWRADPFPVLRDLIVDRRSFDRIIQAGGFISANTGNAPDANAVPVSKPDQERSMDAAACISCGACVAACPNASAMLFVAAKVSHLGLLPQGQPERHSRVLRMVEQMDEEGFGNCTNHYECEAACPKDISVQFISRLNSDYLKATMTET
jgi:succinate dehydrogenase / fumarate reductase iron-sulfur subunit